MGGAGKRSPREGKVSLYRCPGRYSPDIASNIVAVTDGKRLYKIRCDAKQVRRLPLYVGRARKVDIYSPAAERFLHLHIPDFAAVAENKEKLFRMLRDEDAEGAPPAGTIGLGFFDATLVTSALISQYGEEFLALSRKLVGRFGRDTISKLFELFLQNEEGAMTAVREMASAVSVADGEPDMKGWLQALPTPSGTGYLLPGLAYRIYVTSLGQAYSLRTDVRLLYKYHRMGIVERLLDDRDLIRDKSIIEEAAKQLGKIRPDMVLLMS